MEVTLRKMWLQDGPHSYKSTLWVPKNGPYKWVSVFFSPRNHCILRKKQVTVGTSFLLVYQVFSCVSIVSKMNCTDCCPWQFLAPTKKNSKLGDPEQHLECKNNIISIFGLNNILQKMGKPKISNFLKICKNDIVSVWNPFLWFVTFPLRF